MWRVRLRYQRCHNMSSSTWLDKLTLLAATPEYWFTCSDSELLLLPLSGLLGKQASWSCSCGACSSEPSHGQAYFFQKVKQIIKHWNDSSLLLLFYGVLTTQSWPRNKTCLSQDRSARSNNLSVMRQGVALFCHVKQDMTMLQDLSVTRQVCLR